MPTEEICKVIHQYNKYPISIEDMEKLQDIAKDVCSVKNYVHERYGGVKSIEKLYPGYTIQNEMTNSGLREQLALPSVYFYSAIFDALGDIKTQWSRTKDKIQQLIELHQDFTPEEKHYLRFMLKVNNCFQAILLNQEIRLPKELIGKYQDVCMGVDVPKLNSYLKRQVRRNHKKMHTEKTNGFIMTERAYRYGNHGIYISTKEKRKRIFVPLTDSQIYNRQIHVRLYPKEQKIELIVPIDVKVQKHENYIQKVGLAFGMFEMLTTDCGHVYGKELGEYLTKHVQWIQEENRKYRKNKANNTGRKKYLNKKRKMDEQIHSYINMELNRFLKTEKPSIVYIPKLPANVVGGKVKKYNFHANLWQRGYIKKRLMQKCREHSIEVVEVFGKGISSACSRCGEKGMKKDGYFFCEACGYKEIEKVNTASNVKKRGLSGNE